MEHLSGILNSSDDLTKPLGWILHSRHARRSMGHYKLGSPAVASSSTSLVPHVREKVHEAGEGVGAQFVSAGIGATSSPETPVVRDNSASPFTHPGS